jgi:hypothetical protein
VGDTSVLVQCYYAVSVSIYMGKRLYMRVGLIGKCVQLKSTMLRSCHVGANSTNAPTRMSFHEGDELWYSRIERLIRGAGGR